jgi:hypothetical protein
MKKMKAKSLKRPAKDKIKTKKTKTTQTEKSTLGNILSFRWFQKLSKSQ